MIEVTSTEASTSTSSGPRIEQVRSLCLINLNGLGVLRCLPTVRYTRHFWSSHLHSNLEPLFPLSKKNYFFNPFFVIRLQILSLLKPLSFNYITRMDVIT